MREAQARAARSRAPRLTKYEETMRRQAAAAGKPLVVTNPFAIALLESKP